MLAHNKPNEATHRITSNNGVSYHSPNCFQTPHTVALTIQLHCTVYAVCNLYQNVTMSAAMKSQL